jgi:hypothetical protein
MNKVKFKVKMSVCLINWEPRHDAKEAEVHNYILTLAQDGGRQLHNQAALPSVKVYSAPIGLKH